MMNGFFPAFGFMFLWGIHGLSAIAGVVGLVLLIGWALKHAPARTLKHWALWLIGIGLVLSFLTAPAAVGGLGMMRGRFADDEKNGKNYGSFRQWMMNFDDDDVIPASSSSSAARR